MNYVLLFATLALVAALPLEESAVSEEAKSTVSQLLSIGKSSSACKSLADAAIKEVKDSVKNVQKILETNKDGSQCEKVGESLVSKAKNSVVSASKAIVDATAAANAACSAEVTFKPQSLSSLKNGECGFVTTDPAFVLAKKKCTQMKKSAEEAKGFLGGAKTALVNIKKAAEDDKKKCRCAAQKSHKMALEAAEKVNSAANKKAWDKAHNMQCVLNGQSTCKVPSLPSLRTPTLDKRAAQETCPSPQAQSPKKKQAEKVQQKAKSGGGGDPRTGKTIRLGAATCRDGTPGKKTKIPFVYAKAKTWLECKTKGLTLKDAIGFTVRDQKAKGCLIFFPAPKIQSYCDAAMMYLKEQKGRDWKCYGGLKRVGLKIAFADTNEFYRSAKGA